MLAAKLVEEAPTLEDFRKQWVVRKEREQLMSQLPEAGKSAILIRTLQEMQDYDLYDVLAELGYGMAPRTRTERSMSFSYKNAEWLSNLPTKGVQQSKH